MGVARPWRHAPCGCAHHASRAGTLRGLDENQVVQNSPKEAKLNDSKSENRPRLWWCGMFGSDRRRDRFLRDLFPGLSATGAARQSRLHVQCQRQQRKLELKLELEFERELKR